MKTIILITSVLLFLAKGSFGQFLHVDCCKKYDDGNLLESTLDLYVIKTDSSIELFELKKVILLDSNFRFLGWPENQFELINIDTIEAFMMCGYYSKKSLEGTPQLTGWLTTDLPGFSSQNDTIDISQRAKLNYDNTALDDPWSIEHKKLPELKKIKLFRIGQWIEYDTLGYRKFEGSYSILISKDYSFFNEECKGGARILAIDLITNNKTGIWTEFATDGEPIRRFIHTRDELTGDLKEIEIH